MGMMWSDLEEIWSSFHMRDLSMGLFAPFMARQSPVIIVKSTTQVYEGSYITLALAQGHIAIWHPLTFYYHHQRKEGGFSILLCHQCTWQFISILKKKLSSWSPLNLHYMAEQLITFSEAGIEGNISQPTKGKGSKKKKNNKLKSFSFCCSLKGSSTKKPLLQTFFWVRMGQAIGHLALGFVAIFCFASSSTHYHCN